jgi:hypothetical protein
MAVYKVPQDVEADDKLLGPFTFRQFIYLIIVALACGMAWLLSQIFIPLAIIPLPIILFFGAIALPIKKDQPMEAYLGAMVSFYFIKPRKRLWQPDGLNSLVEITAPRTVEPERAKDISRQEARERLSYLTDIVETRGWAVRGVGVSPQGIIPEPESDMLDDSEQSAQRFDQLLESREQQARNAVTQSLQQNTAPTPSSPVQAPAIRAPLELEPASFPIQSRPTIPEPTRTPLATRPPQEPQSTSETAPSPAIIELAHNSEDLTIATVAEQAQRIKNKERGLPEDEVSISLH